MHPTLEFSSAENYLLFQPLAHIYGVGIFAITVSAGARMVMMPKFNLKSYVELVTKYKVSITVFLNLLAWKIIVVKI